ncbi:DUF305 domain-containing protein [Micromonospora sp. NBC_01699]|uniref:DUF305 domain-containing protein n=1 Tax=Micromonospora sp. NBC_01699 TaxID=2975984 RepID=UPI002E2D7A30|nr:DUF305 domain-containing protein [Micromonospora sp. NBC_01699]
MTTARTPNYRLVGAVAILVATVLAVALVQGWGRDGSRARADQPAVSATRPATTPAAVELGGTDLAYLQLMVPMNDSALAFFSYLDTSEAAPPALRDLAGRLAGTHRAEVGEMRSLLAAGNVVEENIHEGHQMPGMVTESRVADLKQAPAAEFATRAATLVREHLAQSVLLSKGEQESGGSDQVRALAAGVERARNAELAELAALPGGSAAG